MEEVKNDKVKELPEMNQGKRVLAHISDEDLKAWKETLAEQAACENMFMRLMVETVRVEQKVLEFWEKLGEKYDLDMSIDMSIDMREKIVVEDL